MRDLEVGDPLDQFVITELLGRSGMASLFKATDTCTGAAAVLKVPHVQFESDVVFYERFRREERIGQTIRHPNVVRVLEPREKSRMYLAMEYVEGRSLHALLQETGPLAPEAALAIARQVGSGLACLHEHGVVHRDIKPENVHVTPSGAVKILDFGIALLESARRLTWAGLSHAIGTPDYMAPEQIRGRRGDARTDVYALGTLLHELLTGATPFAEASPEALLRLKLERDPDPPGARRPGIDPGLDAIVTTALARDPRDRFQSAAELLAALEDPRSFSPRRRAPPRARALPGLRPALAVLALAVALAGFGALAWLRAPGAPPRAAPAGR